jgi:hypothetical protein
MGHAWGRGDVPSTVCQQASLGSCVAAVLPRQVFLLPGTRLWGWAHCASLGVSLPAAAADSPLGRGCSTGGYGHGDTQQALARGVQLPPIGVSVPVGGRSVQPVLRPQLASGALQCML